MRKREHWAQKLRRHKMPGPFNLGANTPTEVAVQKHIRVRERSKGIAVPDPWP